MSVMAYYSEGIQMYPVGQNRLIKYIKSITSMQWLGLSLIVLAEMISEYHFVNSEKIYGVFNGQEYKCGQVYFQFAEYLMLLGLAVIILSYVKIKAPIQAFMWIVGGKIFDNFYSPFCVSPSETYWCFVGALLFIRWVMLSMRPRGARRSCA